MYCDSVALPIGKLASAADLGGLVSMAFCSACGAQQTDDAVFCSSCGKAVAGSPVSTENPEGFAAGSTPPTPGKDPLAFIKRLPKPALIAIPAVVIVAIVGAVIGFKALNAPTKDNAETFLLTASDLPFDVKKSDDPTDYTVDDIFGKDCNAGQELSDILQTGEIWAISELERAGDSQNYLSLDQQIIAMPSEDDAKAVVDAAAAVASDSSCQSSDYSTTMSYKFDYTNDQSIQDVFGVGADGVAIEANSWIFIKLSDYSSGTESTYEGYYAWVRRGNLIMQVYVSSSDGDSGQSELITRKELVDAVAPAIAKFAG